MSESKTLTIQLSAEDSASLEAEAKRLNLPLEVLASIMLRDRLAQVKPQIDPRKALQGLVEIGRNLPPVDVVKLVRSGRQELEERGII